MLFITLNYAGENNTNITLALSDLDIVRANKCIFINFSDLRR